MTRRHPGSSRSRYHRDDHRHSGIRTGHVRRNTGHTNRGGIGGRHYTTGITGRAGFGRSYRPTYVVRRNHNTTYVRHRRIYRNRTHIYRSPGVCYPSYDSYANYSYLYPHTLTSVAVPSAYSYDVNQYYQPTYVTEQYLAPQEDGRVQPPDWQDSAYDADDGAALLPRSDLPPDEAYLGPMRDGDAAFRAGEYHEARRHYIRAQLDGPYAGEATLAYAMVSFAEGRFAVAAMALRRGLEAVPDAVLQPIDVLWLYGGDTNRLGEHMAKFEAYSAADDREHELWFLIGYVRFGSGDAEGAVEAISRAIDQVPGDSLYLLLREAAVSATQYTPPAGDAVGGAGWNRSEGLFAGGPDLPH